MNISQPSGIYAAKKYKIIIFDLDDTIIDNKESVRSAFKTMLEAEGLSYSDGKYERWYEIDKQFWVDWQDGLIEIPLELKHETGKKSDKFLDWVRSQRVLLYFDNPITPQRAIELNNIYMNALHKVVIAIEDASKILKYLSSKYRIVVATNGPSTATEQKLEKVGCLKYVAEVLSADMFGHMKPKIEFFRAIENHYQDHSVDDYLIVGDSLKSDIGFGMNAGIDSCWFNRRHEKVDDIYKPTYQINKLCELKDIL